MRKTNPTQTEFSLSKEDNLLKCFEEIHDYIYAHDGLSPQQTLEEFIKILFVKIYDEQNNRSYFRSMKNGDLVALFYETKIRFLEVFDENDRIRLPDSTLTFIIEKLQNVSLSDSSQDAKGLAFQKFLSHHEKDSRGQFFTPEPVIDFCVKMLAPQATETIIDPACGSGGFLFSALDYIRYNTNKSAKDIITKQLFGIDISRSIARIAQMKLLLTGNCRTNIFCANSLGNEEQVKSILNNHQGFDIVLTNPPFGAKISDPAVLSLFELGYKWSKDRDHYFRTQMLQNSQTAEILFIERSLKLLKPGGRMAIVLPNGNFDNSSLSYLRYYIKERANITAVVRLPQETFIPYGTGVKTSILFLEKKGDSREPKQVFFAEVSRLGYQGNKNGTILFKYDQYGKPIKQNGQPLLDEDFTGIVRDFHAFQKGELNSSSQVFVIDHSQLNGRFDYDYYSPKYRKHTDRLTPKNSVRLGDVCEIVREKSAKLRIPDLMVNYIELSDVNTHSFEIIGTVSLPVHQLPSRASYEVRTGDILTAIAGNSVGTPKHAVALISEEFDGFICTNGFRILRNVTIDPYFLLFFLKSEMFLQQMFMLRTGAAIPSVSDADLADVRIYMPEKSILKNISDTVKKSFHLRQESRKLIEQICLV